jgi:hypothetical protein
MPWRPALTQLRDALADLYPGAQDARRVAASALLPVDHIDLQGSAVDIWQAVLEEAEKQGRTAALIEAATGAHEYPTNPALRAAAAAYHRASAPEGAPRAARPGCSLGWTTRRGSLTLNVVLTLGLLACAASTYGVQVFRPLSPGHEASPVALAPPLVALALIAALWIAWGLARRRR